MHEQLNDGLTLFGQFGSRKYLNAAERARFIESTQRFPAKLRLICLTLGCSGARISEVLAITPHSLTSTAGLSVSAPSSAESVTAFAKYRCRRRFSRTLTLNLWSGTHSVIRALASESNVEMEPHDRMAAG